MPTTPQKKSPGNLRMKCMIWEPNPISERVAQDVTVVYNSTTIERLAEDIQRKIVAHKSAPYGIYLKEKYVYRDTFIRINGMLAKEGEPILAENGTRLFDDSGVALYPYADHQMFVNVPSIYKNEFCDGGVWLLSPEEKPFQHDGHYEIGTDDTNKHDFVDEVGMFTSDRYFDEAIENWAIKNWAIDPDDNTAFFFASEIIRRKNLRYMPRLLSAVSETQVSTDSSSSSGAPNKVLPIHWMFEKLSPMYSGEDFFVEFEKGAYSADTSAKGGESNDEYIPLNAKYQSATDTVIRNGGVVEVAANGSVVEETTDTYNLMNQPYYMIEMGPNDPDHNYVILLAYNSYPIFVHMGRFNVLKPATEDQPPKVIAPPYKVSRRLSTYRSVSCKTLMERNVRITVRNHLGKIIITFAGYENDPWVISRTDLIGTPEPSSSSSSGSEPAETAMVNVKEKTVAMIVPNKSLRIGGGNMKTGFLFSPLHYDNIVSIDLPNAVTVRGPVEEEDINLFLGERGRSDRSLYFQDAENYFEVVSGLPSGRIKTDAAPIWPIKSSGKDCLGVDAEVRNAAGAQISYIAIAKSTPLLSSYPTGTSSSSSGGGSSSSSGGGSSSSSSTEEIPGAGHYIKWFNAKYTLRAGDADVGSPPPSASSSSSSSSPAFTVPLRWRIWNTITPIATGWRMYVPPNTKGHGMGPVDVAHHVRNFSHSWTYSDNAKVEHTGNIKFSMNLGTPMSLMETTSGPVTTDPDSTVLGPADTSVDQTAFLAGLVDKTFFVRVYAWWEGGYMDCDEGCPCRSPGGPGIMPITPLTELMEDSINDRRHCIFTGLCHGGEMTVKGNIRYMDCQLHDYMKILQDQYFLNSPFFDGMNDYFAVGLITHMAGFTDTAAGGDNFAPASLINNVASISVTAPGDEWTMPYSITGETMYFCKYTLPSSYDVLQNPFMKFADKTTYDEALSKIGMLAGKVPYFDRYGIFRYDVRPDTRFLSAAALAARKPKCNFVASPHALSNCAQVDLLALDTYTYKRVVSDVFNDILLVTANPEGEVLIKNVLNLDGRYDATKPGYIGYTKRLLQMDGIFGSERALESIANYYSSMVFKPPTVLTWNGMGCPHLQAMDIVTFTGLNDDMGFPPHNVEPSSGLTPFRTVTLILTSVSGEINADKQEWRNKYEGEWLYG